MSLRKQCLLDPTELMHMCTYRDWARTHKTCTGPWQKGSQHWEEKLDNQTKKLLVTGICWQKENQFSQMDCHWAYQAHSMAYCEVRSWPTQNELYGVFLLGNVSFCFGIFVLLFSYLIFMFVFLWFQRESHRHTDIHTKKEGKSKREGETDSSHSALLSCLWFLVYGRGLLNSPLPPLPCLLVSVLFRSCLGSHGGESS